MASHEFRTPLSTILSSASLLAKYTESEEQDKRDKHIGRIKSSVNNLSGILNEFLSIGVGARPMGMSGAVAASTDDASSAAWPIAKASICFPRSARRPAELRGL